MKDKIVLNSAEQRRLLVLNQLEARVVSSGQAGDLPGLTRPARSWGSRPESPGGLGGQVCHRLGPAPGRRDHDAELSAVVQLSARPRILRTICSGSASCLSTRCSLPVGARSLGPVSGGCSYGASSVTRWWYASRATYRFRHRMISALEWPSLVRRAAYSRVRWSWRSREMATR
jgi:hypothetical protein